MRKTSYHLSVILMFLLSISKVSAQDQVIQDTGKVVSKEGTTTFSGYVDVYYAYSLNNPPDKNIPYTYNYSRHNEFNLNVGVLSASYSSEKIHGTLGIHTGTYPQFNYAAEPLIYQHIHEAYAGFRPWNKAWIDAGIFNSHIGFESSLSNTNWTLTRSLGAENTPYFESGVKLTWEANEKWTLTGLILNGWQNIHEVNTGKAIGTQLQYKPSAKALYNWSTYLGNEFPDSIRRLRIFNDFFASFKLGNKWKLAPLFDIGFQKDSTGADFKSWYNGSLLLRYEYSDHAALGFRTEYYHDPAGIIIPTGTKNGFQTSGASINFDYKPAKNFMWRIEAKQFLSKDEVYKRSHSLSSQSTILTTCMIISF